MVPLEPEGLRVLTLGHMFAKRSSVGNQTNRHIIGDMHSGDKGLPQSRLSQMATSRRPSSKIVPSGEFRF